MKEGISESEFIELFRKYYQPVRNFVYFKTGDTDLADDIVQDSFMKLWERKTEVRVVTAKSLLYTIAGNLSKNRYEHQKVVFHFANKFMFYKDADISLIYNDIGNSALLYTLYFQDKIRINSDWLLKPGLRINLYDNTGKFYFEPRLSAGYNMGKGLFLKMATGKYFQYLNKSVSEQTYGYNRNFWVLSDRTNHPVVSSVHLIIGGSYEKNSYFFDLEAYFKTVDGIQEYLFFPPGQRTPDNSPPADQPGELLNRFVTGKGRVIGIDFLAKYENTDFTNWLAYSLGKSVRNFREINENEDIPAPFDQTHEFKWTSIYRYGKWNFSTLALFATGRPYIKYAQKDINFNTTREYDRLPDYFRLDLATNYQFNLKKFVLKPGVSVINALNTKNYYDIYTREIEFRNTLTSEKTLVKAQDFTINLFLNFRF